MGLNLRVWALIRAYGPHIGLNRPKIGPKNGTYLGPKWDLNMAESGFRPTAEMVV